MTRKNIKLKPTIDRRAIGARIKAAREARGWSQTRLAKEVGVASKGVIANWESGFTVVSGDRLVGLCIALRRTADWLLTGRARRTEIWRMQKAKT